MEDFKQNMLSLGTGQMEYGGHIPKAKYGMVDPPLVNTKSLLDSISREEMHKMNRLLSMTEGLEEIDQDYTPNSNLIEDDEQYRDTKAAELRKLMFPAQGLSRGEGWEERDQQHRINIGTLQGKPLSLTRKDYKMIMGSKKEGQEEIDQSMFKKYGGYIPKALYGLTEDPDENPYDKGTQEWTEWEGDSTTDSGGDPAKGTQNWATQNTGGTGACSGGITTGTTTVKKEERKPLLGDWGENMLGDLLKYGPTIYNLGRGALDKTTKFPFQGNPYAEQVKKKAEESEKLMNPDSLMNENRKYLNYLKYIAKTKGNPSSYMATIQSGLTKTEEANRNAVLGAKDKLAGIKGKNLRSLMALGEYDRKETLGNKQLTLKAEEMQNKMVKAGLTGASKLRFNEELMDAFERRDNYKVRILDKWLNDPSGKGLNELIDSLI